MATTEIEVKLPVVDATDSIGVAQFTATTLTADMAVKKALENKNNSLFLVFNITTAGTLTLKAGDRYPNTMLGDLNVALPAGITAIQVQDAARFENADGSIKFTTATASGTVYAVAKRAGILPVDLQ